MKVKVYTRNHNIDILKSIDNNGGQFTAEEHAYAAKKEFADKFRSKESIMHWFVYNEPSRLASLGFLLSHMKKEGFKDMLSLGAGSCYQEYLLKGFLPEDARVVATDFDPFFIERARAVFPGPVFMEFDFFKDRVTKIKQGVGFIPELAVFFGSTYVMDDEVLVGLFKELKESGVRQIVDLHSGFMDMGDVINYYLLPIKKSPIVRKIFKKPPEDGYRGKFHGYHRTRDELRRLYKESGFHLIQETSAGSYKYIGICNSRP